MKCQNKSLFLMLVCATLIVLSGCQNAIDGWQNGFEDTQYAYGAMASQSHSMRYSISVQEIGAFYINELFQLSYYDYEADDNFVLCSSPNCTHLSSKCVAYAGETATGFSVYGGYGYYIRRCGDTNQWELVEVDISSQTLRIVCVFGSSGENINEWMIHTIGDVHYHHGQAWLSLQMYYNAPEDTGWNNNGYQLIAISLENGQVTSLTNPLMSNRDVSHIDYSYFGENYVGFNLIYYYPALLSEKEYMDQNGLGFSEGSKDSIDVYNEYLNAFFEKDERKQRCYLVELDSMEILTIQDARYDGPTGIAWERDNEVIIWQGDSENRNDKFVSLDLSSGTIKEVMMISNGGLLAWSQGAGGPSSSGRYNGDSVLYLEYIDGDRYKINKYMIETGDTEYLFEIPKNEMFQIMGQTSDKLVGMVKDSSQYAWIYKSDFEQGDFSTLHKFSIN